MATHDYNLANDTHANLRADANNCFAAIRTFNSGASAPTTTFPNMVYANTSTTPNLYYVRNNGDSAWASLFTDTGLIRAANGAVGGPSIGWSATTTHGLYYGSSTSWSAAVAGVNAFTLSTTLHGWNLAAADFDFSIGTAGAAGANTFFVQGSDGNIGLGTNAPSVNLHGIFDGGANHWMISGARAAASVKALFTGRGSRGTHASPGALSSGDEIFRIASSAYHSTGTPGFVTSSDITFLTDGAESGDTVPTRYRLRTMSAGGALVERTIEGCFKTLTDNVATTLFTMACANNTAAGCILEYFVESADASNVIQVHTGIIPINVCNTAGTVTTQVGTPTTATQSNFVTSGTMTVAVTASAANPSVVAINANPSTTTTLLRCIYNVKNLSNQAITIS